MTTPSTDLILDPTFVPYATWDDVVAAAQAGAADRTDVVFSSVDVDHESRQVRVRVSTGRGWWTFRVLVDEIDGEVPGVQLNTKSTMHVLLAALAGFSAAIGVITATPLVAVALTAAMVGIWTWWMNHIMRRVLDVLHLGVLEEVRVRRLPAAA